MPPTPLRAVLDANVLFPFSLRDTLLRAAAAGFFQVYWSKQILDEATRSLEASAGLSARQATHLRIQMERAFPEAMVTGHEKLIASMMNQQEDRHVAAAAARAGAQIVVTSNLKDFSSLPAGIVAQSPDDFLCGLFTLDGDGMVELLEGQASDLKKPPMTFEQLLAGLSRLVPRFARAVRAHRR